MRSKLHIAAFCSVLLAFAAITASAQPGYELGIKGGFGMTSLGDENTGFVSAVRSFGEFVSSFSDNYESKSSTGFQFGAFATINVGSAFAIQPEILYAKRGAKIEGSAVLTFGANTANYPIDEKLELTYIEIPVLVKYRIPMQGNLKPGLFAGPALAFNLSGTDDFYMRAFLLDSNGVEIDSELVEGKPDITNIKSTSLNFVIGGDLKLEAGSANFILDIRYTIGTGNVFEDVDESVFDDVNLGSDLPSELPVASWMTGVAPDMKNSAFSIMVGVSMPM